MIRKIKSDCFIKSTLLNSTNTNVGLKHFYYAAHKDGYTAYSSISNNQLEAIRVVSPWRFDFPIEKIIKILSEPRYMLMSFGASFETPDIYPYIIIFYPKEGYAFRFELPRSRNQVEFCIEPTSLPSEVYITKEGSLEDIIEVEDSFVSSQMDANQIKNYLNSLVAWSGYKCNT